MLDGETPPYCQKRCLIAQRPNLDEYGLALSRQCPGPVSQDGASIHQRVEIGTDRRASVVASASSIIIQSEDGSERSLEVVPDVTRDNVVCRNKGINMSLDMAIERGNG